MIRFNDLLAQAGLDPGQVSVMLHSPREAGLARMLPFWAETAPALFDTYQAVHSPRATATLRARAFVASFVRVQGGTLAFVGVYAVKSVAPRAMADIAAMPEVQRLIADYGTFLEFESPAAGAVWDWCDLVQTDILAPYIGRLQIRPSLTQTYVRLAENLDAAVVTLSEASVLTPAMPDWRDLVLSAADLRTLPPLWQAALAQWRGVYLICDQTDGARYVGAAYNADNFLGRWRTHVAGPFGITAGLKTRETRNFRFSVLERVSPDMLTKDIIPRESGWKSRLHTREFGLNEN